jgi:sulfur-oxidizing protein SoxZ
MARKMQMRARKVGDIAELMVRVAHPMETGLRKDKETGKKIPAHFIQNMTVTHNGKVVVSADLGIAISKNPIMGFGLVGAKSGDKVTVAWSDNQGEKDSQTIDISI